MSPDAPTPPPPRAPPGPNLFGGLAFCPPALAIQDMSPDAPTSPPPVAPPGSNLSGALRFFQTSDAHEGSRPAGPVRTWNKLPWRAFTPSPAQRRGTCAPEVATRGE